MNAQLLRKHNIQPLSALPREIGFRAGYSVIADGNMSFRLGPQAEVLANRERFFGKEGIPADRLISFFTEHSDHITIVEDEIPGPPAILGKYLDTTDVIMSNIPGAAVFLTFADCVPVAFYDRKQHRMVFAHIGWRSMAMSLAAKVIAKMRTEWKSSTEDIWVAIGPCIKKESYLFPNAIQENYPAWRPFLEQQEDGQTAIDLFGFCMQELKMEGIPSAQIFAEATDTAVDPRFYSHYAETVQGQMPKRGRFLFYSYLANKS